MHVIEASRDLKSLERYLPLFIGQAALRAESGLAARRRALRHSAAINPDRLESGKGPVSVIPYAFELWIAHLGWLDQVGAVIGFTLDDLRSEEAQGLALLRRAREGFWREHNSCPHCQSVNLRTSSFCGGCGKEFQ